MIKAEGITIFPFFYNSKKNKTMKTFMIILHFLSVIYFLIIMFYTDDIGIKIECATLSILTHLASISLEQDDKYKKN